MWTCLHCGRPHTVTDAVAEENPFCTACLHDRVARRIARDRGEDMKLRPLRDRVVVKREEAEQKVGTIIIPEAAQEKPVRGRVIAVGSGRVLDSGQVVEPVVKVGDLVVYGKYQGHEVKVEGEEFVILGEDEIMGVLEE